MLAKESNTPTLFGYEFSLLSLAICGCSKEDANQYEKMQIKTNNNYIGLVF